LAGSSFVYDNKSWLKRNETKSKLTEKTLVGFNLCAVTSGIIRLDQGF